MITSVISIIINMLLITVIVYLKIKISKLSNNSISIDAKSKSFAKMLDDKRSQYHNVGWKKNYVLTIVGTNPEHAFYPFILKDKFDNLVYAAREEFDILDDTIEQNIKNRIAQFNKDKLSSTDPEAEELDCAMDIIKEFTKKDENK